MDFESFNEILLTFTASEIKTLNDLIEVVNEIKKSKNFLNLRIFNCLNIPKKLVLSLSTY